jgi:hypothetical protein
MSTTKRNERFVALQTEALDKCPVYVGYANTIISELELEVSVFSERLAKWKEEHAQFATDENAKYQKLSEKFFDQNKAYYEIKEANLRLQADLKGAKRDNNDDD